MSVHHLIFVDLDFEFRDEHCQILKISSPVHLADLRETSELLRNPTV